MKQINIDPINPEFISRAQLAFAQLRLVDAWLQEVVDLYRTFPGSESGVDGYRQLAIKLIQPWLPVDLASVDSDFGTSTPTLFWSEDGKAQLKNTARFVRFANRMMSRRSLRLPDAPHFRGYDADGREVSIWADLEEEEYFRAFARRAVAGIMARTLILHGSALAKIQTSGNPGLATAVEQYAAALREHAGAIAFEFQGYKPFCQFARAQCVLNAEFAKVGIPSSTLGPIFAPASDWAQDYVSPRALCHAGAELAGELMAEAVTHIGSLELSRFYRIALFQWNGEDAILAHHLGVETSILEFDTMICSRVLFALAENALVCMDGGDVAYIRGLHREWIRSRHAHDELMRTIARRVDGDVHIWKDLLFPGTQG